MENMETQDRPIEEIIAERTPESVLEIVDIEEYKTESKIGDSYIYIIPLHKLTLHPLNRELYGDEGSRSTQHLEFLIDEHGYRPEELLLVDQYCRIVDGANRWIACVNVNLEYIPCLVKVFNNDEEVLEEIFIKNGYRHRTLRQIYTISKKLHPIVQAQMKLRMSSGGKGVKYSTSLRADDIVGKRFNMSGKKLMQLWEVFDREQEFPKIAEGLATGKYSVFGAWTKIEDIHNEKRDKIRKFEERKQSLMNVIASFRSLQNPVRKDLLDMLLDKYSIPLNIRNTTPDELRHEIFTLLGRSRDTADETYKTVKEYFEYAINMTKLLGTETITIPYTRYIDSTERHGVRCLNVIIHFPFGRAEMKQERIPINDVAYLRQVIREGAIVQGIVMINDIPHHIVWIPRFPRPPSMDNDGNLIPEIIIPEPLPLE